jgi:hypothetical protein
MYSVLLRNIHYFIHIKYLNNYFSFPIIYQAVLADNGRLKYIERIAERFADLTMAHKGEVKVVVRTVIVS